MRNLLLSLAGVAIFIVAVGLITKTYQGENTIFSGVLPNAPKPSTTPAAALKTIKVGNVGLSVIVADNGETRQKGLGGVTNLAENEGMLFVFQNKSVTPSFWMKGMKIAIDMIWIRDNKIVQIDSNALPPSQNTADSQLKIYTPTTPVDHVIEVNANWANKNGVKVGDAVTL